MTEKILLISLEARYFECRTRVNLDAKTARGREIDLFPDY